MIDVMCALYIVDCLLEIIWISTVFSEPFTFNLFWIIEVEYELKKKFFLMKSFTVISLGVGSLRKSVYEKKLVFSITGLKYLTRLNRMFYQIFIEYLIWLLTIWKIYKFKFIFGVFTVDIWEYIRFYIIQRYTVPTNCQIQQQRWIHTLIQHEFITWKTIFWDRFSKIWGSVIIGHFPKISTWILKIWETLYQTKNEGNVCYRGVRKMRDIHRPMVLIRNGALINGLMSAINPLFSICSVIVIFMERRFRSRLISLFSPHFFITSRWSLSIDALRIFFTY